MRVLAVLVAFLASASALVMTPAVAFQQQLATNSRTAATQMREVVRVEIEIEDGEPYAATPLPKPALLRGIARR
jgi:O-acetylhomoserine/O-acetylserine sulfhydrylase-like pyridoxal-dependent enzyme